MLTIPEDDLLPVHGDTVRAEHIFLVVHDASGADEASGIELRQLAHIPELLIHLLCLLFVSVSAGDC